MPLQENPPTFAHKVKPDKFKYILSLITEIRASNKDIRKKSSYTPLNAQTLSNNGVHDYNHYLKYLVDYGILETDNHFIMGEKSRGYRYTAICNQADLKIERITDFALLKAIDKAKDKRENKYQKGMKKKYCNMAKHLEKITIDQTAAESFLAARLEKDKASGDERAWDRYRCAMVSTNRLVNHDYYFTVDSKVGRLHTNLTNMPSALRNYVTCGDTELISVDISCSQPCLAGALLKQDFWNSDNSGTKSTDKCTYSTITQALPIFSTTTNTSTIISIPFKLEEYEQTLTGIDVQYYLSLTQSGKLYDTVKQQVLKIKGIDIPKGKVKAEILMGMYSNNNDRWVKHMVAYAVFRIMFPSVVIIFDRIKSGNYAALSHLLQGLEARLVLDLMVKRISTELPDMPIFTIHDSIVVPLGSENYVATVMEEEMIKAIGIKSALKYDY